MILLLALAGCADWGLFAPPQPAVVAGEPAIRRATGAERTWPNLASVPLRPDRVPTPAERQRLLDRLVEDRARARLLAEDPSPAGREAGTPDATPDPALAGGPPPASALAVPQAPPPAPPEIPPQAP